tara:strand:+ start:1371 stop:2738 length:1368 start_codon:yes stop_codon:yes gene_type:complete
MSKKNLCLFFLIPSFFLLIYTFYKSEIIWDGLNREYYKPYYLFSLAVLFFSFFTFFLKKKTILTLIIISLSIIFGLYIVEAYMTLNKISVGGTKINKKRHDIYKKQTGKEFDKRSRIEIYRDEKKVNKNISIVVSPSSFLSNKKIELFPFAGLSNSKTINCNENGYYSIFDSDRYGFNNPDDVWNKNKISYLILGDSYAFGSCVNRPYDIASALRIKSKETVINLGYNGNGPLIELASLKEYIPNEKKIEKILFFYYEGNDLKNLSDELKNEILLKYLKDENFSQKIKFRQKEVDNLILKKIKEYYKRLNVNNIKVNNEISTYSEIFKFLKINKTRRWVIFNFNYYITEKPEKKVINEFFNILKLIKKLSKENNSKFYFVYIPSFNRYNSLYYNNSDYIEIKEKLKSLNIEMIDLHDSIFKELKNKNNLFPFERYGHFTIEGNNKIAETIYKLTK